MSNCLCVFIWSQRFWDFKGNPSNFHSAALPQHQPQSLAQSKLFFNNNRHWTSQVVSTAGALEFVFLMQAAVKLCVFIYVNQKMSVSDEEQSCRPDAASATD